MRYEETGLIALSVSAFPMPRNSNLEMPCVDLHEPTPCSGPPATVHASYNNSKSLPECLSAIHISCDWLIKVGFGDWSREHN